MRRRLLNLLTALSMLLCAATVVLWARGYRVKDVLLWPTAGGMATLESNRGQFVLVVMRSPYPERSHRPSGLRHHTSPVSHYSPMKDCGHPRLTVHFERFGFESHTWWDNLPESQTWVKVPHYAVALAAALLPLGRARPVTRRRHPPPGLCPGCGYDLRATPGKCPECGTPAKTPA